MINITGFILIAVGVLALVYQGFTYTQTKQDAQIGDLKIQHNETQSVPISPIVGGICIVAGVAVLVMGSRRN